ncbi:MAG TPA: hypothetical protein GXZ43_05450 [Clostridiaceae bacterium]|nr:hypothetical protein [Clostridiaceae bacterium]
MKIENCPKQQRTHVGIAGIGLYFPEKTVDTRVEAKIHKLPENVYKNIGIDRIYVPNQKEQPSYMAYHSSKEALLDSDTDPEDIDLIIVSCFKNDFYHWAMSDWLCDRLGFKNALTIEIKGGCGAFYQAIEFGVNQINGSKNIKTVMVVSSERLFGYGWPSFMSAGSQAVILKENSDKYEFLGFSTYNYLKYHAMAYIPYGGTAQPFQKSPEWKGEDFTSNVVVDRDMYFDHIKPYVFDNFRYVTKQLLDKTGVNIEEIDFFVTLIQQDNFEKRVQTSIGIPEVKNAAEFKRKLGHFSGADPYVLIKLSQESGLIKKGDLILNIGLGGVAWYATLIRY